MRRIITFMIIAMALAGTSVSAKVNVVASTSDLASIAQAIGGDHVSVKYIVNGKSDPHFVEVLPNYMVMVSRADLYLKIGLGLDFWANPIIDGSRNGKLVVIDCSTGVDVLGKPTGQVNASMGDVHPEGNPHYQLDPSNGLIMADNIEKGLVQVDPGNASAYEQGFKDFKDKLQAKLVEWQKEAEPLKGLEVITYHESWPYFNKAFGMSEAGFIEPKPGIEPTASHTAEIIQIIKARNIKIIIKETYFSDKSPNSIASATGAKVVNLPPSVDGVPEAKDYFSLFDTIISRLTQALEKNQ
jgi:zinc/manganese transport system substrate-binding protein